MHINNTACLKLLFIGVPRFKKLKIKIARYKKNLDFWRNLQNFVMDDFTKFMVEIIKSKKYAVVTKN
jgi:hypothetical protein